jgi:hypothetical protein
VAARVQLGDEVVREDLGAAAREGHLRPADGDSHDRIALVGRLRAGRLLG